jgi:hypothetical protein
MKPILVPILLLGITLAAREPGAAKGLAPAPQSAAALFSAPVAGARVSLADAQRMIQDRENRLNPSNRRRDFAKDPGSLQGWTFSRKSILAMLAAMKDQSDDAPIYIVMGHTEDLDAGGNPIPGSWHETLILCESRPFSLLASPADYLLQHPVLWP